MHYLLFYEVVPGYLDGRAEHRDDHLRLAWAAHARGDLVLGGALADDEGGAVLLFKADTPAVAEAFAAADPYVRQAGAVARPRWTRPRVDDRGRPPRRSDARVHRRAGRRPR